MEFRGKKLEFKEHMRKAFFAGSFFAKLKLKHDPCCGVLTFDEWFHDFYEKEETEIECDCMCHEPGFEIVHMEPCCNKTYQKR